MEHLNWGSIQLALGALVSGGLQLWWISSILRRLERGRPWREGEFRTSLQRSAPLAIRSKSSLLLIEQSLKLSAVSAQSWLRTQSPGDSIGLH